jgi:predicted DNA-binding transcriptional regulator AlpA
MDTSDTFPPICTAFSERQPYDILTLEGLADLLKCHVNTIRRAWQRGELPQPFQLPNQRYGWFVKDVLQHWETHRIKRIQTESPQKVPQTADPLPLAGKVSSLRNRHAKP